MANNSIIAEELRIKYEKEIRFVRNADLKLSNHARKRMSQRRIKIKNIYKSVEKGVLIEVHDRDAHLHGKDVKFLFQDAVEIPPYFLVDVAVKPTICLVVTAYLPDEDKWYVDDKFILRRK